MCLFSRPVEHVSATKIFARGCSPDDPRQVLVYSMRVAAREPLAMVLPIPVPPGSAETAVEMVNLERYPAFFEDVQRAFPASMLFAPQSRGFGPQVRSAPLLAVHAVGAYEASFVPSPRDFGRLDPRFRLAPDVLAALPQYADWGFVVFQLAVTTKPADVHPMALRFPRRDPQSLFFPTVHVHDGSVPAHAHFDHHLFGQFSPLLAELLPLGWDASLGALGSYVDMARSAALVDGEAGGHGAQIVGTLANRDHYFQPPAGITLHDLSGRGTAYVYRVRATYLFASYSNATYPRWNATAQRLPALCRGIREGLAALVAANAHAWRLGAYVDGLRPHFMNGTQLWQGSAYWNGSPSLEPGPGFVHFKPFSQLVEPQDIVLAFDAIPDTEGALAIERALSAMLDRAVA